LLQTLSSRGRNLPDCEGRRSENRAYCLLRFAFRLRWSLFSLQARHETSSQPVIVTWPANQYPEWHVNDNEIAR
jgi:hypothetical protein